jgi:hypothetical protein
MIVIVTVAHIGFSAAVAVRGLRPLGKATRDAVSAVLPKMFLQVSDSAKLSRKVLSLT